MHPTRTKNRFCRRCNRRTPTPYLLAVTKLFPEKGKVLDIGCGNGRNTIYMEDLGYEVTAVDQNDDFGTRLICGKHSLPGIHYDIILANYFLMFLHEGIRHDFLENDIHRVSKIGTILVAEYYPAKCAHPYNTDRDMSFMLKLGWNKLRKSKDRFTLIRGDKKYPC